MMKLFVNTALALTGATAIFMANTAPPEGAKPCAMTSAGCTKVCDLKPGECQPCPNGGWCCLDKEGRPQCCLRAEGGDCMPCPLVKCGPAEGAGPCSGGKCSTGKNPACAQPCGSAG